MKLAILSRNSKLYSTRRLVEAARTRGHTVRILDPLRCYMRIAADGFTMHYKGRPITGVDATGFFVMSDVSAKLRARGITVVLAGRQTEYETWAAQRGVQDDDEARHILRYPTLRQAMRAYALHPTGQAAGAR